jgi:hypothetical protein
LNIAIVFLGLDRLSIECCGLEHNVTFMLHSNITDT